MKRSENKKRAELCGVSKQAWNILVGNIADDSYINGYNHVLEIAQKCLTKEEYARLKDALKNA